MFHVFQPYAFAFPQASGMAQPLVICLALIQTPPDEVGLVPLGKWVMLAAVMSPVPRFMAVLPIIAVDAEAPALTGEVKPVESCTFPFMCITLT